MKQRLCYLPLLLLVLGAGCGKDDPSSKTDSVDGPSTSPAVEENLPALEGSPTVEVWSWEDTLAAVHQHPGEVVVLNLWATWAETLDNPADQAAASERAKKEALLKRYGFDEFVRLKKLYRDQVVAISLNTDYANRNEAPETLIGQVRDFVTKRGANFSHGISSVPDEELQSRLEIFGMPAVMVFDKQGELRQTFFHDEEEDLMEDGKQPFSYRKDVIPLVDKLLEAKYTPPKAEPKKEAPSKEETTPKKDEVSLQILDWEGLQKLVADRKGRVVVVDLWSTSCVPCMKEFPNLVRLNEEKKTDVACLSFNLDYFGKGQPEDLKPPVLGFLKKQNATFPNILSSEPDDAIYKKLDLAAIPAVLVYDRAGKLRKRFDDDAGEFTYEKDILPFVDSLIEEK